MNEPRELVFFSDRDLSHRFPVRLTQSGIRVERHDDHFGPRTPDEEWIGEIGRRWGCHMNSLGLVLKAAQFAAHKHRNRRRSCTT